jgi:hypothetical protein
MANRPTQHRIPRFDSIKDGLSRYWAIDIELNISLQACKRSQMCR